MTGVPGAEEIEDGLAASKALNESRPRRLCRPRHLMCLVLPSPGTVWILLPELNFSVLSQLRLHLGDA